MQSVCSSRARARARSLVVGDFNTLSPLDAAEHVWAKASPTWRLLMIHRVGCETRLGRWVPIESELLKARVAVTLGDFKI